jgi:hypothetical protein
MHACSPAEPHQDKSEASPKLKGHPRRRQHPFLDPMRNATVSLAVSRKVRSRSGQLNLSFMA